MHTLRIIPLAALLFGIATSLPAQQPDPAREIQEIARSVDEQLQEIDRLLIESSKKSQSRSAPKDMLKQASERSQTAEDGIERLIEKLTEMKNQGGGGSSSDQKDPQQGDQQPQPGQGQSKPQGDPSGRNRRENQNPEFVPQGKEGEQQQGQPEPQPGQQKPDEPKPSGAPDGGQQSPERGENTTGTQAPDSETGPGQRGEGDQTWGELQSYVNFLKNRGSAPKVPEKYRKYWEAYLKQKSTGGGK